MINPNEDYLQTAPVQYINKKHALIELGMYLSYWGEKVLISGGERALGSSLNTIEDGLLKAGLKWETHIFAGECCDNNIDKIANKARNIEANIILGVGGGKSIDSAKLAADRSDCYMVAVPTIASTCSATSALSVIYTSSGIHKRDHYLPSHPVLVLIDPVIIAEAPDKYLKSGIIDSLSKWYEGRAVFEDMSNPDLFSQAAINLAELVNKEITEHAYPSVKSCLDNRVNESLIKVIDLNIYLTGIIQSLGQKTCRGAAAHAIHNGLTVLKESHDLLHGIKVAYGIIVQLFLENKSKNEINNLVKFFKGLDIVPSLKGLGLPVDQDTMLKIGEKTINDELISKMPKKIELETLLKAMKKAENHVCSL